MGKPKPTDRGEKRDDQDEGLSQAERFEKTARKLGVELDEAKLRETLRRVARQGSKNEPPASD